MDLERASKKARLDASFAQLDEVEALREQVQREFTGARLTNVQKYADYIERRVLSEQHYSLPAQSLYTPDPVLTRLVDVENGGYLEQEPDGYGPLGLATAWINHGSIVVNTDSETQAAALFLLMQRISERSAGASRVGDQKEVERLKELRRKLDSISITYELHFDATLAWAKHSFFIRNRRGIKHSGQSLNNQDDPLIATVQSILEQQPAVAAALDPKRRQATDEKPLTLGSLSQFAACILLGLSGVQKSNIPDDMDEDELERLRESATEWMRALTATLGEQLTRRDSVASTPQVLAALGAVGHAVHLESDSTKRLPQAEILKRLGSIDWSKASGRWNGVAGKLTVDGAFSQAGGVKEWATRIYSAIVNPASPFYLQVTAGAPLQGQPLFAAQ
ncbi:DNA sulfur modification protein DndB [Corallococcus caeni]|uniref:DNA sulfur modification protein DndB n=1 Tax=Corallococcus caeni TaxID=3082388 RepID=UPI0030C7463E